MSFGERFLHHHDLFPARPSGEVWGERELVLELPGGPYAVGGLCGAQVEAIRERFGAVCHPTEAQGGAGVPGPAGAPGAALVPGPAAEAPGPRVLLFRMAEADFRPIDLRGWEYSLDTDPAPAAVRLAGLRLAARLDWRPVLGGALWTPDGGGERFPGIFENFCRVLVAYRLLELGGVVLHSAGVVRHGAAFLFVGRSGAGKTTVAAASAARGAEVLSDDLNALLPGSGGGAQVAQLPFTGDLGERRAPPRLLPLAALLRLEKDAADRLAPLSRAETLALLVAFAPFVNTDPYRREALLAALERLLPRTGAAPAFALRFARAGTFWSILDKEWQSSSARS